MTLLEICIWSLIAGVGIAAMIARYVWGELRKDLANSVDHLDTANRLVATYKAKAKQAKASREFFKGHAIAGTKTIALIAAELIAAEKRAKLHCRMIDDQRLRADWMWVDLKRTRRQWLKAEDALTDQLDSRITWSACPACGRLVECTGWPCTVGTCRHCGYNILESEICISDPISQESDLIDTTWALYQAAKELHASLTRAPDKDQGRSEVNKAAKRTAQTIAAAEKAWPDIVNPPAFRPENTEIAKTMPRLPRSLGDIQRKVDDAQYNATIKGTLGQTETK